METIVYRKFPFYGKWDIMSRIRDGNNRLPSGKAVVFNEMRINNKHLAANLTIRGIDEPIGIDCLQQFDAEKCIVLKVRTPHKELYRHDEYNSHSNDYINHFKDESHETIKVIKEATDYIEDKMNKLINSFTSLAQVLRDKHTLVFTLNDESLTLRDRVIVNYHTVDEILHLELRDAVSKVKQLRDNLSDYHNFVVQRNDVFAISACVKDGEKGILHLEATVNIDELKPTLGYSVFYYKDNVRLFSLREAYFNTEEAALESLKGKLGEDHPSYQKTVEFMKLFFPIVSALDTTKFVISKDTYESIVL